jgi:hypothetical protein
MLILKIEELARAHGRISQELIRPIPVCLSKANLGTVGETITAAASGLRQAANSDGPPEALFLAQALESFDQILTETDPKKRGSIIHDIRLHISKAQALLVNDLAEATQLGISSVLSSKIPQALPVMKRVAEVCRHLDRAHRAVYLVNSPGQQDNGLDIMRESLTQAVITSLEVLPTYLKNMRG